MRRALWIRTGFVVVLVFFMVMVGCSKRKADKGPETSGSEQQSVLPTPIIEDEGSGSDDYSEAMEMERYRQLVASLQDVHFDYDRFELKPEMRNILNRNADIIKQMSRVTIQVEGHCDERGTVEYNLALGQKRADATKSYLLNLGVNPQVLSTISYGKEQPLDTSADEQAWSKNRRSHFSLQPQSRVALATETK